MTYLLGRTIWSRTVGVIAATLATFSFALCVPSVSANAETIYILLLVAQPLLVVLLGDALAVATARPRNFRASGSVNPETGKMLQDAAVELEPAPEQ